MKDLARRFRENPLLKPADIRPSVDGMEVTSGASEIGKEALIERLKAAARKLGFTHFEVRNYSPEPREYEILDEGGLYQAEPFSGASGASALGAISK